MSVEFVDTNVVVYAYDPSAGERHGRAVGMLSDLWKRREGALSIQVFQEFYINVTRKIPIPLSSERASRIIADLSTWKIVRPDVAMVLEAIRISDANRVSFWDALILASAKEAGARIVWSEDLNPGQNYDGVEVRNPFV